MQNALSALARLHSGPSLLEELEVVSQPDIKTNSTTEIYFNFDFICINFSIHIFQLLDLILVVVDNLLCQVAVKKDFVMAQYLAE